jgi:hypothetical protein
LFETVRFAIQNIAKLGFSRNGLARSDGIQGLEQKNSTTRNDAARTVSSCVFADCVAAMLVRVGLYRLAINSMVPGLPAESVATTHQ